MIVATCAEFNNGRGAKESDRIINTFNLKNAKSAIRFYSP